MLRHAHNLSSERLRQNELQFSVSLGYVVKMGLERGRWWGVGGREGRKDKMSPVVWVNYIDYLQNFSV